MSDIKEFVDYIDEVFYKEPKDINGIRNSIDLFFEFYKKNTVINDEVLMLLRMVHDKIKEENEKIEPEFLALLSGTFLGMILGRFSKRICLENLKI